MDFVGLKKQNPQNKPSLHNCGFLKFDNILIIKDVELWVIFRLNEQIYYTLLTKEFVC